MKSTGRRFEGMRDFKGREGSRGEIVVTFRTGGGEGGGALGVGRSTVFRFLWDMVGELRVCRWF